MTSGHGHAVIFHRVASEEFLKARRWYATEGGEQLADRFCRKVDEAVERIAHHPESWPIFRNDYRWVKLDRFPYVIYFHVLDQARVMVMAVAHVFSFQFSVL